jgi:uncharacterized protein (DUF302 family)
MARRVSISLLILFFVSSMALADNGLVTVRSSFGVHETANRLASVLEEKGMRIVARIDHTAGAASVGMTLRPTELLVFGNPAVGTPLMQCAQTVAIDLPQKMLIWEDESGMVSISYNDPGYLSTRHDIEGCKENIRKIAGALATFAQSAASD